MTFDEYYDMLRRRRKRQLDALDREMEVRYHAGRDITALKERRLALLRRCAVEATRATLRTTTCH